MNIAEDVFEKLPREVKVYISKLEYDLWHDALTGALARKPFVDICEQELAHTKRKRTKGFALLFMDINDFKKVNDMHGHKRGDDFLKTTAERILKNIRTEDLLARYGGDEFVALLRDVSNKEEAMPVLNRIKEVFEEPVVLDGREVYIGISIGVLLVDAEVLDIDSAFIEADKLMFAAKLNKAKENISFAFGEK